MNLWVHFFLAQKKQQQLMVPSSLEMHWYHNTLKVVGAKANNNQR